MKYPKDKNSVSDLENRMKERVNQIDITKRPVFITTVKESLPLGVLQDRGASEKRCSALNLMKLISQGEADIFKGKFRTQEAVFKDLLLKLPSE